jgi:hypothetical protein
VFGEKCVLAEELFILDANSELWPAVRPLLDVVLRLERDDDTYVWHGWTKGQIHQFLRSLPAHCTLVLGVWEVGAEEHTALAYESLVIGCVCEVIGGEVSTIRTFEALADANLPSVKELEPGFEHAREIMRVVRTQIAPVAWALFTDKTTWDEWLFGDNDKGHVVDKGELLASFALQGRCVLMGSQIRHQCV